MRILAVLVMGLSLQMQAQQGQLVISQVFGGGGNSGAPYTHDFIELFNRGQQPIDLSGLSLQYAAATGSSWLATIALSGTVGPGKYFLVQLAGGAVGNALPAADLTGTINLAAASGKILLVAGTAPLSGNCPQGLQVIDRVGYGTADCFETAAAPAGANNRAITRKNGGCLDSDNNSLDFLSIAPQPRNSNASQLDCSAFNAPLPVVFGNVKAGRQNGFNLVEWQILLEQDIMGYQVETSENGVFFKMIGKVLPASGENGGLYRYLDSGMAAQRYLRIAALEADFRFTYSKIIRVQGGSSGQLQVYPNPATCSAVEIMLSGLDPGEAIVEIINSQGSVVNKTRLEVNANRARLVLQGLKPGVYYIRCLNRNIEPVRMVMLP